MATSAFRFFALSDKVLTPKGVRYLLFFEADEPYTMQRVYFDVPGAFRVFATRNGFHAIGARLGTAQDKTDWFLDWKSFYPNTDYRLQNLNWLAPHSQSEFEYIRFIKGDNEQLECDYFRDKAVWESWESNNK